MPDTSETIMIVDDDPIIRAICRSSFEDNGYTVLEAENGERAIALFKSHSVDVVFLDILMPDKDGLETLLEIKRSRPESRVYVMSGGGRRGSYSYLEIAKRFGATDVVKKPFTPGTLIDLVRADANQEFDKEFSGMTGLPPELLARLGSLVRHDDVQTAQIRVVDLKLFRSRLSEKWDRVGAFVHKSFENAIRKQLSSSDAALRFDEFTYLIVFRDATVDTAQLKCAAILTEVVALCFGERWENGGFENVIQAVDPHAVPMDITAENAPASASEKGPRRAPFDMPSAAEPDLMLQGEDERWLRPDSFSYRPLWDATRNVILHYLCQPERPNPTYRRSGGANDFRARIAAGAMGPEPDFAALHECLSRIELLRRDGFRVRIGAQIHFDTLSDPGRWSRCSALLRDVPRVLLDDLAFHVVGIEDGVPSSRLQTVLSKLAKTSRSIYCVVQDGANAGIRFAGTGAHALGLVMRKSAGSERHQIANAQKIASEAAAHGMEAFILNASTPSLALNAIASGVRYVEGEVICPPTANPRYAFVREIEDLYRKNFTYRPDEHATLV